MKRLIIFLFVVTNLTMFFNKVVAQTSFSSVSEEELYKLHALSNYAFSQWDSLRCVWYGECNYIAQQNQQENLNLQSVCP